MKIMTLNINLHGTKHGPWPERKKLICEAIRRKNPDIVALQAVRKSPLANGGKSQAEEIAHDLTGYAHVAFQGFMEHEEGIDGQAFLSRVPMEKSDFLQLTVLPENMEDPYRRFVYHAVFNPGKKPFHVYNGHFSWVDAQNEANLHEAMTFIRPTEEPAVVVGDFNATSDKAPLELLRRAGWVDLWQKLKGNDPGFTFEAPSPSIRIDYVWANPAAAAGAREIHLVSGESADRKIRLSDHAGLCASFE